ncbi:hypothetical protein K1X76_08800 [bacterium]|nr:hypothetical protein [bacterium]
MAPIPPPGRGALEIPLEVSGAAETPQGTGASSQVPLDSLVPHSTSQEVIPLRHPLFVDSPGFDFAPSLEWADVPQNFKNIFKKIPKEYLPSEQTQIFYYESFVYRLLEQKQSFSSIDSQIAEASRSIGRLCDIIRYLEVTLKIPVENKDTIFENALVCALNGECSQVDAMSSGLDNEAFKAQIKSEAGKMERYAQKKAELEVSLPLLARQKESFYEEIHGLNTQNSVAYNPWVTSNDEPVAARIEAIRAITVAEQTAYGNIEALDADINKSAQSIALNTYKILVGLKNSGVVDEATLNDFLARLGDSPAQVPPKLLPKVQLARIWMASHASVGSFDNLFYTGKHEAALDESLKNLIPLLAYEVYQKGDDIQMTGSMVLVGEHYRHKDAPEIVRHPPAGWIPFQAGTNLKSPSSWFFVEKNDLTFTVFKLSETGKPEKYVSFDDRTMSQLDAKSEDFLQDVLRVVSTNPSLQKIQEWGKRAQPLVEPLMALMEAGASGRNTQYYVDVVKEAAQKLKDFIRSNRAEMTQVFADAQGLVSLIQSLSFCSGYNSETGEVLSLFCKRLEGVTDIIGKMDAFCDEVLSPTFYADTFDNWFANDGMQIVGGLIGGVAAATGVGGIIGGAALATSRGQMILALASGVGGVMGVEGARYFSGHVLTHGAGTGVKADFETLSGPDLMYNYAFQTGASALSTFLFLRLGNLLATKAITWNESSNRALKLLGQSILKTSSKMHGVFESLKFFDKTAIGKFLDELIEESLQSAVEAALNGNTFTQPLGTLWSILTCSHAPRALPGSPTVYKATRTGNVLEVEFEFTEGADQDIVGPGHLFEDELASVYRGQGDFTLTHEGDNYVITQVLSGRTIRHVYKPSKTPAILREAISRARVGDGDIDSETPLEFLENKWGITGEMYTPPRSRFTLVRAGQNYTTPADIEPYFRLKLDPKHKWSLTSEFLRKKMGFTILPAEVGETETIFTLTRGEDSITIVVPNSALDIVHRADGGRELAAVTEGQSLFDVQDFLGHLGQVGTTGALSRPLCKWLHMRGDFLTLMQMAQSGNEQAMVELSAAAGRTDGYGRQARYALGHYYQVLRPQPYEPPVAPPGNFNQSRLAYQNGRIQSEMAALSGPQDEVLFFENNYLPRFMADYVDVAKEYHTTNGQKLYFTGRVLDVDNFTTTFEAVVVDKEGNKQNVWVVLITHGVSVDENILLDAEDARRAMPPHGIDRVTAENGLEAAIYDVAPPRLPDVPEDTENLNQTDETSSLAETLPDGDVAGFRPVLEGARTPLVSIADKVPSLERARSRVAQIDRLLLIASSQPGVESSVTERLEQERAHLEWAIEFAKEHDGFIFDDGRVALMDGVIGKIVKENDSFVFIPMVHQAHGERVKIYPGHGATMIFLDHMVEEYVGRNATFEIFWESNTYYGLTSPDGDEVCVMCDASGLVYVGKRENGSFLLKPSRGSESGHIVEKNDDNRATVLFFEREFYIEPEIIKNNDAIYYSDKNSGLLFDEQGAPVRNAEPIPLAHDRFLWNGRVLVELQKGVYTDLYTYENRGRHKSVAFGTGSFYIKAYAHNGNFVGFEPYTHLPPSDPVEGAYYFDGRALMTVSTPHNIMTKDDFASEQGVYFKKTSEGLAAFFDPHDIDLQKKIVELAQSGRMPFIVHMPQSMGGHIVASTDFVFSDSEGQIVFNKKVIEDKLKLNPNFLLPVVTYNNEGVPQINFINPVWLKREIHMRYPDATHAWLNGQDYEVVYHNDKIILKPTPLQQARAVYVNLDNPVSYQTIQLTAANPFVNVGRKHWDMSDYFSRRYKYSVLEKYPAVFKEGRVVPQNTFDYAGHAWAWHTGFKFEGHDYCLGSVTGTDESETPVTLFVKGDNGDWQKVQDGSFEWEDEDGEFFRIIVRHGYVWDVTKRMVGYHMHPERYLGSDASRGLDPAQYAIFVEDEERGGVRMATRTELEESFNSVPQLADDFYIRTPPSSYNSDAEARVEYSSSQLVQTGKNGVSGDLYDYNRVKIDELVLHTFYVTENGHTYTYRIYTPSEARNLEGNQFFIPQTEEDVLRLHRHILDVLPPSHRLMLDEIEYYAAREIYEGREYGGMYGGKLQNVMTLYGEVGENPQEWKKGFLKRIITHEVSGHGLERTNPDIANLIMRSFVLDGRSMDYGYLNPYEYFAVLSEYYFYDRPKLAQFPHGARLLDALYGMRDTGLYWSGLDTLVAPNDAIPDRVFESGLIDGQSRSLIELNGGLSYAQIRGLWTRTQVQTADPEAVALAHQLFPELQGNRQLTVLSGLRYLLTIMMAVQAGLSAREMIEEKML